MIVDLPAALDWSLASFACPSLDAFLAWTPNDADPGSYAATVVPGSVQTSSHGLPYPEILLRGNWEKVGWMEDVLWVYKTEFPAFSISPDKVAVIHFRGLDYRARLFLNGNFVADHEGMFSPVEIEIAAGEMREWNTLHVAFLPPTLLGPPDVTPQDEVPHLKARYMRGWDFAPRLRCVGIWDEVEMRVASPGRIATIGVETRIENTGRAEAVISVHLNRALACGTLRVELLGQTIEVPVNNRACRRVAAPVANPDLWFPHTHGPQRFHDLRVSLLDENKNVLDSITRRIGLREVRRAPACGQLPADTPAQYLLNGQPVFLNGANLTPFSSVPALVREADYRRVLDPLKAAGINFLRVWGGGLKEKECFYRLCDEMGFLVLQEFPLACQSISRDSRYLALLEQEARAIVRALASHPCVIWWTGGNEHYHFWEALDSGTERMETIKERMRDVFDIDPGDRTWRGGEASNHPALQLLHSIVQEEVPSLPYNVTSGLEDEGETHGPWNLRLEIGDHRFRDWDFFDFWRESRSHLYSEASISAAAAPETFVRVLELASTDALRETAVPATRDDAIWVAHKAFRAAWDGFDDLWLDISGTEQWFGPLENLADLIFANHYLQCEASRFMIEAVRRRQGQTTGVVWWGVNEPYPSLAGNALVDFFGNVKPALTVMRQAFAPRLLSLDYDRCVLRKLKGELFFTNSLPSAFHGSYRMRVCHQETGSVVDTYEGRIQSAGYSVARLATLTPTPVEKDDSLSVEIELLSSEGEIIDSKLHRIFSSASEFPLRPLLSSSRKDIASLFFNTTADRGIDVSEK